MKTTVWVLKALAFTLMASLSVCGVVFGIQADHLQHERDKYRTLTIVNREQAIQTQLKYEAVQRELDETQMEFAAAKKALHEYAEKERTQARASRSRASRASAHSTRRSTGVGVSRLSAGLRDVTKYCPTGNTTASGKQPRVGMVATISRSIPFGTRVLIEGLGEFVVEDRIGHGSEFDIFTNSCSDARRFGRQHRRVTILDS